MKQWMTIVLGLALASAALTRLGDALWSPGLWPGLGLRTFVQKTVAALIATAPISLLLGFWALRLRGRVRPWAGLVGAAALCGLVSWLYLSELRGSDVVWGGKIPPLPWLATSLPYLGAVGFCLGVEAALLLNRRRPGHRSAASAARSGAESRSGRSAD